MPAADRALVPDVATLYSDHHGWLLGWLRKRLGNAFDAADLTQDTYVRLLGRSVT
ncbi:sigma factor, partial [Delftia tsuruhatensis]|uniref:sigma factor n=1 Tax=Delftia tsuruhatensis TaxID=180282 RepID=UPI0023E388AA